MRYLLFTLLFAVACSSNSPKQEPKQSEQESTAAAAHATPPTEEHVTAPATPATPTSAMPEGAPGPIEQVKQTSVAKAEAEPIGKIPPKTEIWKLQKGKLTGPGVFGHPTVISKTKNKKGNGTTTETCYRYATYAVVELRSTDEVGSGELTIRYAPPRGFNLCFPEFKGKTTSLRIIEGYFAGVAGGLIMIDGADSTEGQTEFQIFKADSGLEVIKSFHHPTEEFTINKVGDDISLDFYAKLPVRCELALEGQKCWEKVLKENKVVGKTPMPDCPAEFAKTKTALTEPALVFTRARIAKLGTAPKYLGGKSTCQPAP